MPKYEVEIQIPRYRSLAVEAKDESEAYDLAIEELENEFDEAGEECPELNCSYCEEIKDA